MDLVEELNLHLGRFDFESAFQNILGWAKFRHSSILTVPDIGKLPRGWRTKETRRRLQEAPRLPFLLRGVASLGPKVALHCYAQSGRHIDELSRDRLTREIAKLFHDPLVIFTSEQPKSQDWYFPSRTAKGLDVVRVVADGPASRLQLVEALLRLRIGAENLDLVGKHVEVTLLSDQMREDLRQEDELTHEIAFARKYAQYGDHIYRMAREAFRARELDLGQAIEIAARAKRGEKIAIERFYEMHQYLVFMRAREYLRHRMMFTSEFDDYLSEGLIGVGKGLSNYDPESGFAPSTLICHYIDKHISRAFGRLELPMWIPTYKQEEFLLACHREDAFYQSMVVLENRIPEDAEVLESIGLRSVDIPGYCRFRIRRLRENRCEWEEPTDDELEPALTYTESVDKPSSWAELVAVSRLSCLRKDLRDTLMLRLGIHPEAEGTALTHEEIAQRVGVSRERVRQKLLLAESKLRNMDFFLDNQFSPVELAKAPGKMLRVPKSAKREVGEGLENSSSNPNHVSEYDTPVPSTEDVPKSEQQAEHVEGGPVDLGRTTTNSPLLSDRPPQLAYSGNVDKTDASKERTPPSPPLGMRSSAQYLDFLLETLGQEFDASRAYEALKRHYPLSGIKFAAVVRKARAVQSKKYRSIDQPSLELHLEEVDAEDLRFPERTRTNARADQVNEAPKVPPPPYYIRKPNAYAEYLLDEFGATFSPEAIHKALLQHFPKTIINEAVIAVKFKQRGYALPPSASMR